MALLNQSGDRDGPTSFEPIIYLDDDQGGTPWIVIIGPGPDRTLNNGFLVDPAAVVDKVSVPVCATLGCMDVSETDVAHLWRCVALAREALDDGDEPFGSVLVDAAGTVRFEDRNRVKDGDHTRHPEFEIARWSATHLTLEERHRSTVYTSGEHCPMCSAAHAWMGLGRIVFAASSAQLTQWLTECGAAPGPVAPLPVQTVAPSTPVTGPVSEFAEVMRDLHRRNVARVQR